MRKEEFEALIEGKVSDKDYADIEHVYTWHPAISNTEGKKQIAMLYKEFGMSVIRGMECVATFEKNLDEERKLLNKKLNKLNKRQEYLKKGNTELEIAISRTRFLFNSSNTPEEFKRNIKAEIKMDSIYLEAVEIC